MFVWLNKQGVKSDKGFVVQSIDRFTILYKEGLKEISVYVENGFSTDRRPCEIVNYNAFEKWDNGTIISGEKQKEIMRNFKEALEFQGLEVIFK